MELETVGQELVKCVLVGDTAVGKTRLICARACNIRMSLRQLLTTHVPTVWAIDQYRMYKEVLERSMTTVDGVPVSLRLWDTFGDHEKDRRFAYGRSDVILLCFSIGSRSSLLHCKTMWYPEIRRFCPDTPIVLVGCKNDLRFLCRDSTYQSFCRDRSPFLRPVRECDLVMPEQARTIAKDIGAPYYETSVFTYYGVNTVFENAIRSSLIARRSQRFWMTNLKHVQTPLLQAPYCPPKKELNTIEVFPGSFWMDIKNLLCCQHYTDLVFIAEDREINLHRFVVAAGSPTLSKFLTIPEALYSRRNSSSSGSSNSTGDETECLLKPSRGHDEKLGYVNEMFTAESEPNLTSMPVMMENPCWGIKRIQTQESSQDFKKFKVVVELNNQISYDTILTQLYFIYTGELPQNVSTPVEVLKDTAEMLKIHELTHYLDVWSKRDAKQMNDLKKSYRQYLKSALWDQCAQSYHTDVIFHLDDGKIAAHRALLMARSDMMRAMFSGDFRERRSQSVSLPGVKKEAFSCFLEYLYTDSLSPPVPVEIGMPLIELANRLCLPRLVNILESLIIHDIAQQQTVGIDMTEECIRILEVAQLHNAEQLAQWCLLQLATNYDIVCRKHGKLFKELCPENRQWVSHNRWPPVWYVKDFDYYQKALMERHKIEHPIKKGRKRNNSGCLCFPGKSRKSSLAHSTEHH